MCMLSSSYQKEVSFPKIKETIEMKKYYYVKVSPRGFANETGIVRSASKERLERYISKINNDSDQPSAYADFVGPKMVGWASQNWTVDLDEADALDAWHIAQYEKEIADLEADIADQYRALYN